MISRSKIGLTVGAGLLLTGCSGSLGESLGFGKRAPDEFAVVKRQPLIVPPDYDLRPPDPNARGPLPGRADARARASLTGVPVEQRAGRTAMPAGGSAGETALIRRSAEVQVDPDVRRRLSEESGGAAAVDAALFERLTRPGGAAGARPTARDALTADRDRTAADPADGLPVLRRSSTQLEDF